MRVALGVLTQIPHDRWWLMLLLVVAGLVLYHLHMERLAAWRELGRIRMQIARDLHDDLGASLSQIALLSEVVRCRVPADHPSTTAAIQIGNLSREVLDGIADTVWSLNPDSDSFAYTIERMRDFATDLFAARNIAFRFQVSCASEDFKLTPLARRQILLTFKEAVNNIVRHADCNEVDVTVTVERQWLQLSVADNGKGLDWDRIKFGHGLHSMQERARTLGGQVDVTTNPNGTCIVLRAPWKLCRDEASTGRQRPNALEAAWNEQPFASASSKISV